MNFLSSLRYLNSFLNMERIQLQRPRLWNLDRMRLLMKWAGYFDKNPDKNFFPVLIAGTKGKGSTGFFLESILKESGISVGFYSSPHLQDPRERIRIDGLMISKRAWCEEMAKIKKLLTQKTMSFPRKRESKPGSPTRFRRRTSSSSRKVLRALSASVKAFGDDRLKLKNDKRMESVTYFEIMTLLAMQAMKRAGIQIGIFEVGMGGRLDATNVLPAKLAILTPIHLDHEAILGNTIAKIAYEKAAIIKRGASVVVAPQKKQAIKVILIRSRAQKAKLYEIKWGQTPKGQIGSDPIKVGLAGDYQRTNAAVAQKAAELLRDQFNYPVTSRGLDQGVRAKNWPGRFEILKRGGAEFLLDGAHNPISIEALVRNSKRLYPNRKRLLIFGTARDKKSALMLRTLSRYFSDILGPRAQNPRSIDVETLLLQSRGLFSTITPAGTVREALEAARRRKMAGGLIVVTGSFYLIGEIRKKLKGKSKK